MRLAGVLLSFAVFAACGSTDGPGNNQTLKSPQIAQTSELNAQPSKASMDTSQNAENSNSVWAQTESSSFPPVSKSQPPANAVASFSNTSRHYLIMFASEGSINLPSASHTWATMITIKPNGSVQEETISWLPAPGYFTQNNTVPRLVAVPGHNYNLDETLALESGREITYWNAVQVTESLYKGFMRKKMELESGQYLYKMFVVSPGNRDRVSNCIMAVSSALGYLDTGTAYGIKASQDILDFFASQTVNALGFENTEIMKILNLNHRIQIAF